MLLGSEGKRVADIDGPGAQSERCIPAEVFWRANTRPGLPEPLRNGKPQQLVPNSKWSQAN